jgi:hypothetical protein
MTDKQIFEKLEEIEAANPVRFKQYKLKDHLHWEGVADTHTLKWGFHAPFIGNLERHVKVEVSKMMNKLTKSGYSIEKIEKAPKKVKAEKIEEKVEEKIEE